MGLESTPDEYVANMVAVFREVWRVLRDDGTLWVNLGDSYAGSGKGAWDRTDVQKEVYVPKPGGLETQVTKVPVGLKHKDLVGIPWRVAFALQADGWYLRQDIIWAKPNPMPESVRDRCTKAHEYVFLLTKRQKYYYDADAIAEAGNPQNYRANPSIRAVPPGSTAQGKIDARRGEVDTSRRNRRSVWTVNTQPYPEAHFATFPEKLVEPCVLAGTKPGDLVMDPFAGSGTVGAVCRRLARKFVGVELNPAYVGLAVNRLKGQVGLALEGACA